MTSSSVTVDLIVTSSMDFVCGTILGFIAYLIFINLNECGIGYIKNIPISPIKFSDKHNWIIKPSSFNKSFALLATFSYTLGFGIFFILDIIFYFHKISLLTYEIYGVVAAMIVINGHLFRYFYLVTTLKYHMKSEKLIKNNISNNILIFVVCFTILGWIIAVVYYYLKITTNFQLTFHGVPYIMIGYIVMIAFNLIVDTFLLYLYISGWWKVCIVCVNDNIDEYNQNGETERGHEISLRITRATVIVIISIIITTINYIWAIVYCYILKFSTLHYDYITNIMWVINVITNSLSIYMIYEFGHRLYENVCNKYCCHNPVYSYFHGKIQYNVQNGAIIQPNQYMTLSIN